MDRYDIALKNYIDFFGDDEDISEYVSTWDYNENDFVQLANKLCYQYKSLNPSWSIF